MPTPQRYKTDPPVITDTEIASIRVAAHRYLLAGGAIFLESSGGDRDEHLANIRDRRNPDVSDTLHDAISRSGDETLVRQIEDALGGLLAATNDAGYLFGVCVGLEVARLTIGGELPRAKKGGTR